MAGERYDVAIVGAGVAGLSIARRLRREGLAVLVLEARDRVGGRTLTIDRNGAAFDLGGQWIGAEQTRLWNLSAELGLETFAQHHLGEKVLSVDGRRSTYRGFVPPVSLLALLQIQLGIRRLESMARKVPLARPADARDAETWDAQTVDRFAQRILRDQRGRALFDVALRTVFGAEAAELSLLHFLFYVNSAGGFRRLCEIEGGAQEARFALGAQTLSRRLAAELEGAVVLSSPVRRIVQRDDGVELHGSGVHAARYAVVAVPPQLAGRIEYEPALPALRRELTDAWKMGATVKVLAFYEAPRWRERGLSGEAVCTDGPLSVVFDNCSPLGDVACLLGFVVGDAARRWSTMPAAERRALALGELERLIGMPAAAAVDYVEQDWTAEPWSGGCPVAALPPGRLTRCADVLRAPVGRVHWAGTETARHWNGYLEGALESAERVSADILACLSP
jgi:monoamine oxidase